MTFDKKNKTIALAGIIVFILTVTLTSLNYDSQ